jgi:membrane protein implicated in regulation of membrane protease activity
LIECSDGVRGHGVLEEYRGVGDVSVVGCVGSLIVATRGVAGPGEVLLSVRGSKEAYLAWSDQPLPRGTEVLVIDVRGARTVLVEPWTGVNFTAQIP